MNLAAVKGGVFRMVNSDISVASFGDLNFK